MKNSSKDYIIQYDNKIAEKKEKITIELFNKNQTKDLERLKLYANNLEKYIYKNDYNDLEKITIELKRINTYLKSKKVNPTLQEYVINELLKINEELKKDNLDIEWIKETIVDIELLLNMSITFYNVILKNNNKDNYKTEEQIKKLTNK